MNTQHNASAGLKRAYIRHYSDSGQTRAYVEWKSGARTEGDTGNMHMQALLARAKREGIKVKFETW